VKSDQSKDFWNETVPYEYGSRRQESSCRKTTPSSRSRKRSKVHGPDAPTLFEGVGDNLTKVHSAMMTNDIYMTWTTGQPGTSCRGTPTCPRCTRSSTTIKGECIWHYKDNDGEKRSIKAGPGDILYLPGGAENKVEVVGDEEHPHRLVPENARPARRATDGHRPGRRRTVRRSHVPVGADYDNVRDTLHKTDPDSFSK